MIGLCEPAPGEKVDDVGTARATVRCASSVLLADLLDEPREWALAEVARTRLSVHYETGRDDVPVLCVCTPTAVRLPASLVAPVLPTGPVTVGAGRLLSPGATWQVHRWWRPPRPHGLAIGPAPFPPLSDVPRLGPLVPLQLVGRGPGLTPAGDDVLAGALVAACAIADPRLDDLRSGVRAALATRRTTAVSRALLHHALDGWATPELAAFVAAVCGGSGAAESTRLLAVGHSSGAALAAGALHVLASSPLRVRGVAA